MLNATARIASRARRGGWIPPLARHRGGGWTPALARAGRRGAALLRSPYTPYPHITLTLLIDPNRNPIPYPKTYPNPDPNPILNPNPTLFPALTPSPT